MTQIEIEQAVESIWTLFRETDRRLDQRIAETDRRLDQRFKETDRRIAETDRLLEALVKPGVAELFQARGIAVNRSLERIRARRGGGEMEMTCCW